MVTVFVLTAVFVLVNYVFCLGGDDFSGSGDFTLMVVFALAKFLALMAVFV